MTVNKRDKHRRFRGQRTYHGSHKKWRGGGNRGGRGQGGSHKHKWSYVQKYDRDHYGKHGFVRPSVKSRSLNLSDIGQMMDGFLKSKVAEKEGGSTRVYLTKAGYDKVLGAGKLREPLELHARSFSEAAERKIQEAGGKAVRV